MALAFERPFWLILIPCCAAFILWIDRRLRIRPGRKARLSRILRMVLCGLLCLALAGFSLTFSSRSSATWVLADVSGSMDRSQVEAALAEGLVQAPGDLAIGVLSFGQNAMVDQPLGIGRNSTLRTTPIPSGTDIQSALSLALGLLPSGSGGRIALLSDGQENIGALDSAPLIERGIAVDVLPLQRSARPDAQISALSPPAQVYEGEAFDLNVDMDANSDMEATLVLYANGEPIATRDILLRKGENHFAFQDVARRAGVITYTAQLIASADENTFNNRLSAYMDVRGTPTVLLVEGKAGDGREMRGMLEAVGMRVETLLPMQMPRDAEALRGYHAIVLANVDADVLGETAILALDDAVRKLGRGLVVLGGDSSYALGGYRGSSLEDILPVTIDVKNRLDLPTVSLLLVIDQSGSMSEGRFGITRMELAKEAAMRSTEILSEQDFVGVISFDDVARWVVPYQQATDIPSIQGLIGTIRPNGGTSFFPALRQALLTMTQAQTQLKHVIFLTDGQAADSGHQALVQQMAELGVTFTTVAVGNGANTALLAELAALGGGRAYAAGEFDNIPKIFAKETFLATQSYVQNRRFFPAISATSPLTDYNGFPALDGYLATTEKPLATVGLVSDRDEPILSWWQYGAGRVVAWTSDSNGAWTSDFLAWTSASGFFSGMVSYVLPTETGEGTLNLAQTGGQARLTYTVDEAEEGLQTQAQVVLPDGETVVLPLTDVAPGEYTATLDSSQEGAYAIRIEQSRDGETIRTLETGIAVAYSKEYDLRLNQGMETLAALAKATGGRVLGNAADLFAMRGEPSRARHDMTYALLLCALLLFLLDAAQRRLAWEYWLPERAAKARKKAAATVPAESKATSKPEQPETPKPVKKDAAAGKQAVEVGGKLLEGRKKKLL
ncbi:MAG TPA: VWA domain-containing protein [Clostridia bacterium]|nr:VWA domain-containing protein [Clostridia bacterium]